MDLATTEINIPKALYERDFLSAGPLTMAYPSGLQKEFWTLPHLGMS